VSISMAPIRSDAGLVIGTCTIAHDVTERLLLLERLEAERRRHVIAQEAAKLGGFELNLDTLELARFR
jgi:signal transduction histidine kinase